MTGRILVVVAKYKRRHGIRRPRIQAGALTDEELGNLGIKEKLPVIDLKVGDEIRVTEGRLKALTV